MQTHFTSPYVRKSSKSIPVYREDGRVVGQVGDGVLIKHARRSKHMLQKPMGWAWDETCIAQAEDAGANQTQIHDDETNQVFTASLADFHQHGIFLNRRFGKQICLPLKYWQVTKPGQQLPQQMSLF